MPNEAFFRAYYTAYNTGDPAKIGALLHDEVVLVSSEGEMRGKTAYLDMYRMITGLFEDQMTPQAIRISGEEAVIDIDDVLTAKAVVPSFLGRAFAPGEVMALKLTGRYRTKDGLIHRIEIGPRAA